MMTMAVVSGNGRQQLVMGKEEIASGRLQATEYGILVRIGGRLHGGGEGTCKFFLRKDLGVVSKKGKAG